MKEKSERLKRLSAQGMSLEELIRCDVSGPEAAMGKGKAKKKGKRREEK